MAEGAIIRCIRRLQFGWKVGAIVVNPLGSAAGGREACLR
jgi:hypothetical protein